MSDAGSDPKYYFEVNGDRKGPVARDYLLTLLKSKEINADTKIWTKSFGSNWKSLREEFDIDEPPPLPTEMVSDLYAWILVAVPLIGLFIDINLSQTTKSLYYYNILVFFTYFVVNTVLCIIDSSVIKKSGRTGGASPILMFWLIPGYLLWRSNMLKSSKIIPLAWIISFGVSILINIQGLFSGSPTYFGGLPTCDSSVSISQVKKLFGDLPLMKIGQLQAVDISNILEESKVENVRNCSAKILASNANFYNISFKHEVKGNNLLTFIQLK